MTNIDPANGIHYGFMDHSSLGGDATDQLLSSGSYPAFEEAYEKALSGAKAALRASLTRSLGEDAAKAVEFSTAHEAIGEAILPIVEREHGSTGVCGILYTEEGYRLEGMDCSIAVAKSRFFTWTYPCSPCCPNAGDLDTPAVHPDRGYPWRLEWDTEHHQVLILELAKGPDDVAPDPRYDLNNYPGVAEFMLMMQHQKKGIPMGVFPTAKLLVPQRLEKPLPTYCLGHEWFGHEGAPYPVFSVETNQLIQP